MKKVKLCIIGNLAPWKHGGIETIIRNLYSHLNKKGFDVTVFCHDKNSLTKKFEYGKVVCLKEIIPFFGMLIPDIDYANRIFKENFDIIHSHYQTFWYPLLRKLYVKKPYVVTFHGNNKGELKSISEYLNSVGKIKRKIGSYFEKVAADEADVIVACSKRIRYELIEYYEINPKKIKVIYNGVDIKKFKPLNKKFCRKILGLENDIIYGLTIGTDPKRKGLEVSSNAVEIASKKSKQKINLLIIGPKKQNTELIKYLGYIDFEKLPLYYNAADFFIFPSRYEGSPLVTLYALACKIPIIVSKNSNVEYISNGKEGFIINNFNPKNYAEKIVTLVKNKRLWLKMAKNARKTATNFSWCNQSEEYYKLYKGLINKNYLRL